MAGWKNNSSTPSLTLSLSSGLPSRYPMAEDVKHPHHCGKCTKRWGGLNTSHCGACHTTFTGLTAFERHRHKGTCLTPEAAGLVLTGREYECYGAPITNDHWST
ncbi:hypothetical protein SEA_MARSHMALLOW_61 [Mycobacterium phage Marshmallow]|nr:hypothetical protein SEA_TOMASZEWSKI_58 [Mycobacterium phage Tomaszewski]WNO28024.1 hypothetical protein SEA_MARSHMALLOW_61 [Mycobacterium phage Marshmallow]